MTTENKQKYLKIFYGVLIITATTTAIDFIKGSFMKSANAAPIEYVDSKFVEAKGYTDDQNNKQDAVNVKLHSDQKIEIDKKASNERVNALLLSLNRVIKQNDMFYKYLLEQKGK